MLYFNRDGSTSSMCGNGLRCFCAFCEKQAITKLQESVVLTGDGYKYVVKTSNSPAMWKINMGKENTYPSSQYVSSFPIHSEYPEHYWKTQQYKH